MPSAIARKTIKRTVASSKRTKRAMKRKVVTLRPCKGKLIAARLDEIVKEHGGRPPTRGERRQFRRFAKDPYP